MEVHWIVHHAGYLLVPHHAGGNGDGLRSVVNPYVNFVTQCRAFLRFGLVVAKDDGHKLTDSVTQEAFVFRCSRTAGDAHKLVSSILQQADDFFPTSSVGGVCTVVVECYEHFYLSVMA